MSRLLVFGVVIAMPSVVKRLTILQMVLSARMYLPVVVPLLAPARLVLCCRRAATGAHSFDLVVWSLTLVLWFTVTRPSLRCHGRLSFGLVVTCMLSPCCHWRALRLFIVATPSFRVLH